MSLHRTLALLLLGLALPTATAMAQPLGSFRWQLQPYCNVITVNVTQQGGIYTLDGTDDRCGGGNQAGSAVGIAYLTPLGLVGFGISSVLPNGTPIHTEATISISSLSGTWRDSAGNTGNFIFTPGAGVAGAPRPIPSGGVAPASITNVQLALNSVTNANIVNGSVTVADLAAPSTAGFVGSTGAAVTLGANTLVRSITITAPAAGTVIVSAQGLFDNTAATLDEAACSLTTGTTIDTIHATFEAEQTVDAMEYVPFALTRGFTVAAGANTFNVVCNEYSGNVVVWYTHMTALFTAAP
jgi:hypothetical protein